MASAPLGTTYYPACVVSLLVKFDEAMTLAPEPPTYTVNGLVQVAAGPAAPNSLGEPLIEAGSQGKNGVWLTRVPKTASVELPAIRKAGTFKLTFDFRDLPIDPRTVRSVAVQVYMDSVKEDEFAEGMLQVNPANGQRVSMMTPAARGSLLRRKVENMVIKGLADSWHVSHTSSGSTVSIEGRDLTGLFLNTPITHELVAACPLENTPIDKVIAWVVGKLPWGEDLQVVAAPAEQWPEGIVPKLADLDQLKLTNTRVRQGAKGKKVRVSAGANQDKMNFWDLVTRYCFLVGAIPTMTLAPNQGTPDQAFLSTIYIQPTTSALDVQRLFAAGTLATGDRRIPFANKVPREVDNQRFVIRRMIFGRNVEDMQIERKFSGKLPKVIEVISYDTSSKSKGKARLLTARSDNMTSPFPELNPGMSTRQRAALAQAKPIAKDPKASGRTGVSPRGNIGKEDILRIPVPGIRNQRQLQSIANALYTEISKGEMGGSVKTRSLSSFGAGNEDPDLIYLRPGDGVQLAVDARPLENRAPAVHPLIDQQRMTAFELMQDMVNRLNIDPVLARVIVASMRNLVVELQSIYRVNTVKYDWDVSKGISLAFDYHNYVEVRNNITPTAIDTGKKAPVRVATGPRS